MSFTSIIRPLARLATRAEPTVAVALAPWKLPRGRRGARMGPEEARRRSSAAALISCVLCTLAFAEAPEYLLEP